MKVHLLEREQRVEYALDQVFEFFAAARNLERIFAFRHVAVLAALGETAQAVPTSA